ncbi:MAG: hypothetical protein EXS63_02735 [Candidatus Omnitrophica bacterium]|nr:hypothetical protein [Candidatus Omnitrophota bacterium]
MRNRRVELLTHFGSIGSSLKQGAFSCPDNKRIKKEFKTSTRLSFPKFSLHRLTYDISKPRPSLKFLSFVLLLTFSIQAFGWAETGQVFPGSIRMHPVENIFPEVTQAPSSFFIPPSFGEIKKSFTGSREEKIILIQDAHVHEEAQRNIAQMLNFLSREKRLHQIYVEGAEGVIDMTPYSFFPDLKIRQETADYFLTKGRLTGAEYAAIVTTPVLSLYGIENRQVYENHRKVYLEGIEIQKKNQAILEPLGKALKEMARFAMSPEVMEFYRKTGFLEPQEKDWNLYFDELLRQAGFLGIAIDSDSQMKTMERLSALGKEIDLKNPDADLKKFPETEKTRQGRLQYQEYLRLSKKISGDFFTEAYGLEKKIKRMLLKTPEEKRLNDFLEVVEIYRKFFDFSLTTQEVEWFYSRRLKWDMKALRDFLTPLLKRYHFTYELPLSLESMDQDLLRIEKFYLLALDRDRILIQNAIGHMKTTGLKQSAVITGGFHTPGIEKFLREQGYSYVVVSPRMTSIPDVKKQEALYRQAVLGRPLLVEKILVSLDLSRQAPMKDLQYQMTPWLMTPNPKFSYPFIWLETVRGIFKSGNPDVLFHRLKIAADKLPPGSRKEADAVYHELEGGVLQSSESGMQYYWRKMSQGIFLRLTAGSNKKIPNRSRGGKSGKEIFPLIDFGHDWLEGDQVDSDLVSNEVVRILSSDLPSRIPLLMGRSSDSFQKRSEVRSPSVTSALKRGTRTTADLNLQLDDLWKPMDAELEKATGVSLDRRASGETLSGAAVGEDYLDKAYVVAFLWGLGWTTLSLFHIFPVTFISGVLFFWAFTLGNFLFKIFAHEWVHAFFARVFGAKEALTIKNLTGNLGWDFLGGMVLFPLLRYPRVNVPSIQGTLRETFALKVAFPVHLMAVAALYLHRGEVLDWLTPLVSGITSDPFLLSWLLFSFIGGGILSVAEGFYSDYLNKKRESGELACGVSSVITILRPDGEALRIHFDYGYDKTDFEIFMEGAENQSRHQKGIHDGRLGDTIEFRRKRLRKILSEVAPDIEVPERLFDNYFRIVDKVRDRGDQASGEVSMVTAGGGRVIFEVTGHGRFLSAGTMSQENAQLHQWSPTEEINYVGVNQGKYEVLRRNRALYVPHNGDGNVFKVSGRWLGTGLVRTLLFNVFHMKHPASSDTPIVAGFMEYFLTQGSLKFSARFAFAETMTELPASSPESIKGWFKDKWARFKERRGWYNFSRSIYPSPEQLSVWEREAFLPAFRRFASSGGQAPSGFYLSSMSPADRRTLADLFEREILKKADLFVQPVFFDPAKRKLFLETMVNAFCDQDFEQASLMAKKRMKGTFGVRPVYSLEPGTMIAISDSQGMFFGINPGETSQQGPEVYAASEPAAFKERFEVNGRLQQLPYRIGLNSTRGDVVIMKFENNPLRKPTEPALGVYGYATNEKSDQHPLGRPLTDRELYEMTALIPGNPMLSVPEPKKDGKATVAHDLEKISGVVARIDADWQQNDALPVLEQSFNRQSGFEFLRLLMVLEAFKRLQAATGRLLSDPKDRARIQKKFFALITLFYFGNTSGQRITQSAFQTRYLKIFNFELQQILGPSAAPAYNRFEDLKGLDDLLPGTKEVDILIPAVHISLVSAVKIKARLEKCFPILNIQLPDANHLLESLKQKVIYQGDRKVVVKDKNEVEYIITADTISIHDSISGMTFPTYKTSEPMEVLLNALNQNQGTPFLGQRVWGFAGEHDTLMAESALGQGFYKNAPFKRHTFSTLSGPGEAEPATVTSISQDHTLTRLSEFLVTQMQRAYGTEVRPFGTLVDQDILQTTNEFIRESQEKHLPEITNKNGSVARQFYQVGKGLLWYLLENPIGTLAAILIFAVAMSFGISIAPSATIIDPLMQVFPALREISWVMKLIGLFFNVTFVPGLGYVIGRVIGKAMGRYPTSLRFGGTKIFIASDFHESSSFRIEQFVMKLWSKAWGFMDVNTFFGDNTSSSAHNHTARGPHKNAFILMMGPESGLVTYDGHDGAKNMSKGQAGGNQSKSRGVGPVFLWVARQNAEGSLTPGLQDPYASTYLRKGQTRQPKAVYQLVLPAFSRPVNLPETTIQKFTAQITERLGLDAPRQALLTQRLRDWRTLYLSQYQYNVPQMILDIATELKITHETKLVFFQKTLRTFHGKIEILEEFFENSVSAIEREVAAYALMHQITEWASLGGRLWNFNETHSRLKRASTAGPVDGEAVTQLIANIRREFEILTDNAHLHVPLTQVEKAELPFHIIDPVRLKAPVPEEVSSMVTVQNSRKKANQLLRQLHDQVPTRYDVLVSAVKKFILTEEGNIERVFNRLGDSLINGDTMVVDSRLKNDIARFQTMTRLSSYSQNKLVQELMAVVPGYLDALFVHFSTHHHDALRVSFDLKPVLNRPAPADSGEQPAQSYMAPPPKKIRKTPSSGARRKKAERVSGTAKSRTILKPVIAGGKTHTEVAKGNADSRSELRLTSELSQAVDVRSQIEFETAPVIREMRLRASKIERMLQTWGQNPKVLAKLGISRTVPGVGYYFLDFSQQSGIGTIENLLRFRNPEVKAVVFAGAAERSELRKTFSRQVQAEALLLPEASIETFLGEKMSELGFGSDQVIQVQGLHADRLDEEQIRALRGSLTLALGRIVIDSERSVHGAGREVSFKNILDAVNQAAYQAVVRQSA